MYRKYIRERSSNKRTVDVIVQRPTRYTLIDIFRDFSSLKYSILLLWEEIRKNFYDNTIILKHVYIWLFLRIFQEYYCSTEPLSAAVNLYDDALSIISFITIILDKMDETISFCALQERTEEIVGVLVAKIIFKTQQLKIQVKVRSRCLSVNV